MGGDHLSNKCYILALFGLLLFVSIASAAQVNEAMGPFKISFELPSKEVTNEIADPLYEDYSTWYAMTTSADNHLVDIIIIEYFEPLEIDLDANRRLVAAMTGVDKSESKSRMIDGNNGIYSVRSSDKGTMLNAICWLDEDGGKGTKKAEIIIASNDKKPDSALKALDSLKITEDLSAKP